MPFLEREYVFISYAHENLEQVLKVYEGLKKRKVNVWIDKRDLVPGRWKPQIFKAISRSKYFVICLSNAAIKKTSGEKPGFQDEELQTAWEFAREQDERGFTIIPVRLEDCGRGDMRLSGWQQYDLFEDWEGVLDKLAVNLGGISLSDVAAIDERTEIEKILAGMIGKAEIFYAAGIKSEVKIIILSVANLGFAEGTTTGKIIGTEQDTDQDGNAAPFTGGIGQQLGLELCTQEVTLNYRLQYKDQPLGERLYVAMKPITTSNGEPRIFVLGHNANGLSLDDARARPDDKWQPNDKFMFCL